MNIGPYGTPLYVWWNGTRMHLRTHVKKGLRGISGQDEYADGMLDHVFFFVPAQKYVGIPRDVPEISAAPESCKFESRPGHGATAEFRWVEVTV